MKFAIALAALPFVAAPAMAGPYVESKTTAALSDGTYKGAQTELRIGYEEKVAKGVTLFGEIGPGYEWTKGTKTTTGETVAVGEVGVKAKLASNVGVQAKLTGEYGNTSEIFDMGGELKVRYSF
jgi:outer membrane autotransporter protein